MSSLDLGSSRDRRAFFIRLVSLTRWKMSYVSNIANSILSRSSAELLGPEIYTAIAEWEKREIPAAIVLTSIEEVYIDAEAWKDIPIEIVQDAVSRNFRMWLSNSTREI